VSESATVVEQQTDLSKIYKGGGFANVYDTCVNGDEFWMGLRLIRRFLIRNASVNHSLFKTYYKGDVLEVSAGTGRNMTYYKQRKISSIIFCDFSPAMLEQVKKNLFRVCYNFSRQNRNLLKRLHFKLKMAQNSVLLIIPSILLSKHLVYAVQLTQSLH
jgi:ubiquinone/menaquinone biosynthesis C-methylase UbiE